MKTTPLDFLLSTLSITLLLAMAILTTWGLSMDNAYHVLLDLAVFLFSYGLYTCALLALLRRLWSYPEGRYAMDSRQFAYWKLVAVLTDLAEKTLNPFTTVFNQPLVYLLLGARVGKNTALAGTLRDHPLLHIGDYATIGQNSVVTAHAITHDEVMFMPVIIGRNAVVGVNCTVLPGVMLGENAVLAPGAVATTGARIPPNELWGGIPARKIKELPQRTD